MVVRDEGLTKVEPVVGGDGLGVVLGWNPGWDCLCGGELPNGHCVLMLKNIILCEGKTVVLVKVCHGGCTKECCSVLQVMFIATWSGDGSLQ